MKTPLPVLFLPVDKTGRSQDNLVVDESHEVLPSVKVIKPHLCAYFKDSIIVIAVNSDGVERPLNKETDYLCTEHFERLSLKLGKEICGSILIDTEVTETKFKITYQAYGGLANPQIKAIAGTIVSQLQKNLINWDDVQDKAIQYNPADHLHDWLDLYGLEYIEKSILYIADAIDKSPNFEDLKVAEKIHELFSKYPVNSDSIYVDATHLEDILNPHGVTKEDVKLGNVQNLKLLSEYVNFNSSSPEASSYNKDFLSTGELKYISNLAASRFIIEYLSFIYATYFGAVNSYKSYLTEILVDLDTRSSDIITFTVTNNTNINNVKNSLDSTKIKYDQIKNWLKQYKHVEWNKELCLVLQAILAHKYNVSQTLSSIINIPGKLEAPYLWLDFSDTSTLVIDNVSGVNYISSITDKSNYNRVFSGSNSNTKPMLVPKATNLNNEINKNTVANFKTGNKLVLSSGDSVSLLNDFTLIILARVNNQSAKVLSNSDSYVILNQNNKALQLQSNKFNISTPSNTSPNFKTLLTVLSASNTSNDETWCAFNNPQVAGYPLGVDGVTKLAANALSFSCIGDITGLNTCDYELAEVMLFSKQLSTNEITTFIKYLSRKWSGQTDFSIDLSFVQTNI